MINHSGEMCIASVVGLHFSLSLIPSARFSTNTELHNDIIYACKSS